MLINEILFEKSRSSLYHFTLLTNAYWILKSNTLKINQSKKAHFTRNPVYNIVSVRYEEEGELPSVRFELDQDKLRYNYKISPYRWERLTRDDDEYEEIITRDITNFNNYLIEILIPNHYIYQDIMNYVRADIDEQDIDKSKYDKNFNQLVDVDPRIDHYQGIFDEDEFYNHLVYMKYLSEHPKMNKKDAIFLKEIFAAFSYIYY